MFALLRFVLGVLASPFKSKSRLEAENVALRQQLIVLRRKVSGRPRLTNNDRCFFIQLYRWFPSILQVLHDHPSRDAGASGGLSLLLALESAHGEGGRRSRRTSVARMFEMMRGVAWTGRSSHQWGLRKPRCRCGAVLAPALSLT